MYRQFMLYTNGALCSDGLSSRSFLNRVVPASIVFCPPSLSRYLFLVRVIVVSFNFGGIFCQMTYLETEVFYTSGSFHTARQFVRACVLHSQMAALLNSWRKKLFSTTTK